MNLNAFPPLKVVIDRDANGHPVHADILCNHWPGNSRFESGELYPGRLVEYLPSSVQVIAGKGFRILFWMSWW